MATAANQRARSGASTAEIVGAGVLALVWLAMLLAGGTAPDRAILVGAYASDSGWADGAAVVTRLGDWEVLVALTLFGAAWLMLRRRWKLALLLLVSTLLARLLVGLQKVVLARVRPAELEHLVEVQTLSFPSGHAANSMIVYLALAVLLTRSEASRRAAVVAAVLVSLLVGISRVLLGVHWPSDVIGGWAFGLLWMLAVIHLAQAPLDRPDKLEGRRT